MTDCLKTFTEVASTASQVLSSLVQKKPVNENKTQPVDKDWDFCNYLHHKLSEIPDGFVKDELLIEIQQLVCRAKRNSSYQVQTSSAPQKSAPQFQMAYMWNQDMVSITNAWCNQGDTGRQFVHGQGMAGSAYGIEPSASDESQQPATCINL